MVHGQHQSSLPILNRCLSSRFPIGLRHSKVLDALLSDCGQPGGQVGNAATLKICDTSSRDTQDGEDDEDASASDDSIDQAEADDPLMDEDAKQHEYRDIAPVATKPLPIDAGEGKRDILAIKEEQPVMFPIKGEYNAQRTSLTNDIKRLDVIMS